MSGRLETLSVEVAQSLENLSGQLDTLTRRVDALSRTQKLKLQASEKTQAALKNFNILGKIPFGQQGKSTEETLADMVHFFDDPSRRAFITTYLFEIKGFSWKDNTTILEILRVLLDDKFIEKVQWPSRKRRETHAAVPKVFVAFIESIAMAMVAEAKLTVDWKFIETSLQHFFTNVRHVQKKKRTAEEAGLDGDDSN